LTISLKGLLAISPKYKIISPKDKKEKEEQPLTANIKMMI